MYWIAIWPRLSRGRSTPAMRAMSSAPLSTLALFVARVLADDPDHARAPHDLAVLAAHLDRRSDFHVSAPVLFETVRDPAAGQVVRGQLDLDPIAREDPDEVHPHLAAHVGQDPVPVFQ